MLLTAALVAMTAMPAVAQDVTIRLSHMNPEDPFQTHSGAMASVFKSLVESHSGGAIEVQLFPNGQLGQDADVIEQVNLGLVESAISSAGGMAEHYPLVGIFDIPFAFPNIGVATRVMDKDSNFGRKFTADLESRTDLKVLGLLDSGGFFAITNSKRPIETLEDMEGLRIRTMTLPTHETIISSLGGQPTALAWAELYTALQTGVAEGQMNPIPMIVFARFSEVQDYLTVTNHILTPYIWTMNAGFYEGLSPEHRQLVNWAAEVATDAGRSISRIVEASERGLPTLEKEMQVNVLSPEEQQQFAERAQPAVRALIEEQLGSEGIEMLDALLSSVEEEMQAY